MNMYYQQYLIVLIEFMYLTVLSTNSTPFNNNPPTPTAYANGRCQSLLQSTSMGSHPLLMVDVIVYYSQHEWAHTLC